MVEWKVADVMTDDEAFLRAIIAAPGDSTTRLVYADWLEERGDPRAEYLRLGDRLVASSTVSEESLGIRRRMMELRPHHPSAWLAALADHWSIGSDPDPGRIEQAAAALNRPVTFVDSEGYTREIVAAATHALTGTVAYVDCRYKTRGQFLDINYYLRAQELVGPEAGWPIESYNPYFGCDVGFLEWYGAAALVIYREKHHTYAYRFGIDGSPAFKRIGRFWALDGFHLAYRDYEEKSIRRSAVPSLEELPSLTEAAAADWGLLPTKAWRGTRPNTPPH
jgi:uncharacterized protein (TIGR02996 family)